MKRAIVALVLSVNGMLKSGSVRAEPKGLHVFHDLHGGCGTALGGFAVRLPGEKWA